MHPGHHVTSVVAFGLVGCDCCFFGLFGSLNILVFGLFVELRRDGGCDGDLRVRAGGAAEVRAADGTVGCGKTDCGRPASKGERTSRKDANFAPP